MGGIISPGGLKSCCIFTVRNQNLLKNHWSSVCHTRLPLIVVLLFFQDSVVSSSAAEGATTRSLLENQELQQQQLSHGPDRTALRSPQQSSGLTRAAKRKRWTTKDPEQNQVAQLEKMKVQQDWEFFSKDQESTRFGQTVADMLRRLPEEHRPQAMFDVYKLLFERQQMYKLTSKRV